MIWALGSLLSFGIAAPILFAVAGSQARKRAWVLWGAARKEAQRLVREEPAVARELGVGRPDIPTARSMGVVDVNHASAGALAMLPGIDAQMAGAIVAAREEIDGFKSLEDCGGVLGLDGNLVEDLRPFVVFLSR